MLFIYYEINFILIWSANCVIVSSIISNQAAIFTMTDTKLYASVAFLSTNDCAKLIRQLKSGFERITNWNGYQSKVTTQEQNQYLHYLIYPSFQWVNRLLFYNINILKTKQVRSNALLKL